MRGQKPLNMIGGAETREDAYPRKRYFTATAIPNTSKARTSAQIRPIPQVIPQPSIIQPFIMSVPFRSRKNFCRPVIVPPLGWAEVDPIGWFCRTLRGDRKLSATDETLIYTLFTRKSGKPNR